MLNDITFKKEINWNYPILAFGINIASIISSIVSALISYPLLAIIITWIIFTFSFIILIGYFVNEFYLSEGFDRHEIFILILLTLIFFGTFIGIPLLAGCLLSFDVQIVSGVIN